ncbi:MAG: alpha/beta fold hydrolase [Granulosicoccaceae bacterium]
MSTESSLDASSDASDKDAVVLVHGIWMNGLMMSFLAKQLNKRGFDSVTISYRSLKKAPAENAERVHELIKKLPNKRVHLVGHSLGGIVILHLLDRYDDIPDGRVVLMGSPVRGSAFARQLAANRWSSLLLGRSVDAGVLGGAPVYQDKRELGIIRGTIRLGAAALVRKPGETNDGVVSESETMISGANDYTDLPLSHSMLIFSRRSANLVAHFLNHGCFSQ